MERSDSVSDIKELNTQQPVSQLSVLKQETAIVKLSKSQPVLASVGGWLLGKPMLLVFSVLAACGVFGYVLGNYVNTYRETENAHVMGNVFAVNSRVSGTVMEVTAKSRQNVRKGAVLVRLDPSQFRENFRKARAVLLTVRERVKLIREEVEVAQANLNEISRKLKQAQTEYARAQKKIRTALAGAFSPKINILKTEKALAQLDGLRLDEFEALQTDVKAKKKEFQEKQRLYQKANAELKLAQAKMNDAQFQLNSVRITAPMDGQVGSKAVRVGQRVKSGDTLISLIQLKPWIVANFPQSESSSIQPGQAVEIKIETFPNRIFKGKVQSVGEASKANLHPMVSNSTREDIQKLVPRVPVKITFDPKSIRGYELQITPGMAVSVSVEVR